jgi:hypothetical protein
VTQTQTSVVLHVCYTYACELCACVKGVCHLFLIAVLFNSMWAEPLLSAFLAPANLDVPTCVLVCVHICVYVCVLFCICLWTRCFTHFGVCVTYACVCVTLLPQ